MVITEHLILNGKHKINPENPILRVTDEFCLVIYFLSKKKKRKPISLLEKSYMLFLE